ncbi:MAG: glycine cleavage system protein H [Smithellaceae bacterium]|nr:glycine cleavage system protein H [Smithellaceae bacterium]
MFLAAPACGGGQKQPEPSWRHMKQKKDELAMRKKEFHMIPEEEMKCIWMTAGLISYKLCTHDYRCEDCVFDQAMRNEAAVPGGKTAPQPAHDSGTPSSEPAPQAKAALFYHRNHCWAKVENPDEVRIGIDGILAKLVLQIKTVVLPQEGEVVTQGQCFAHIIQEKHILQLISPLTGAVHLANQRLKKNPHLLAHDPWEEGWLVTIQPENLEHELKTLLFGRKAMAWYQEKEQVVAQAGAAMLSSGGESLGKTLQDGGEQITGFADMLSSEQFDRIIELSSRTEDPSA